MLLDSGPRRVGQSLTTHHLDAMFPVLHGFIDTNVYYSDDELRKRAEGLVGKLIKTGQEAVEGSARAMREDVYKKHVSADPVAARLPYGIVTKMVQLVGWKRMEMNRLIRFQGVTETSSDSILRRAWVCKLKGRFVSPQQHASIRNAESQGIFIKDPCLKGFLRSAHAACASLKVLYGFMSKYDKESCEQLIEDYVGRLDEGTTEDCMRFAAGLSPRQNEEVTAAAEHIGRAFDPIASELSSMQKFGNSLAMAALDNDLGAITEFRAAQGIGHDSLPGENVMRRKASFQNLISSALWSRL